MADWTNLLDDILILIKEKSSIFLPDFYRFVSVCRKWRSIALEKQPAAIPPLLFLPFDEERRTCRLFDICSNNVIKIRMSGLHDRVVCSASHGWLSTLDCEFDIRLVNLYTQSEILLPRHPRFQELFLEAGEGEEEPKYRALYASKFVLSANPAVSPQNCFVAGIFGLSLELAICKLGDDMWTRISDMGVAPCSDAIFCGNKIYAANCNYTEIFVCNLDSEPGMDPQFTLLPIPKKDEDVPGQEYVYLAESSGDLFCILRYTVFFTPEEGCGDDLDYKTLKFAVFKLDRGWNITDSKWHKVDSLDDRVLFLGRNHSFMISPVAASELPEFKRNCIYFTEDYLEGYLQRPGCYDGGVFRLKDETIESSYPSAHPWPAPPIWLEQRY